MLPLEDVKLRVAQFLEAGAPVIVTRAPLYVNKADLFPRSAFVVGHDTAARLVLPKYYGDSYIGGCAARECRAGFRRPAAPCS
jgi:hypothetical protein